MSQLSDALFEISRELVRRSRNVTSPKKADGYNECIKYLNEVANIEQWSAKHEAQKQSQAERSAQAE